MFFTLNLFAQVNKSSQQLIKQHDNTYVINYEDKIYNIDTTTVTIKTSNSEHFSLLYTIIRANKLGYIDIKVPSDKLFESFISILNNDSSITEIEYNTFGEYNTTQVNDIESYQQWYLSHIKAYSAWDLSLGNSSVVVGVLDSGVDWEHEDLGIGTDLYQNIYTNSGEDAWIIENNPSSGNGIDDDNNGLIDDWKGWNFETNNNDTRTLNYHGTFVSGIISAKSNNNIGIAGIAGGNGVAGVKILPVCIGIDGPITSIIDDAIIYAVDERANIIQLSISIPYTPSIDEAIQYAINNNVIVVCAAGNSYGDVSYPSSNNNVISVGATDQYSQRVPFSNYGSNLDIVAPGVNIYSTYLFNQYVYSEGTSFSAPQVSAIAALILSVNPNLTNQDVRNIIESTAEKVREDLYEYTYYSEHPNDTWNNQMGYGLVDAYAAVMKAKDMDLYVRDNSVDIGNEPSNANDCMWASPDIWIEDANGNIVDNPHGNVEYQLCVRVYNKKNISSSGNEKLFLNWAKAGVDLRWNNSWMGNTFFNCAGENIPKGGYIGNQNGISIPSIPANSSAVVKVTWLVPRAENYANCTELTHDLWHFCLAARIHDGNPIPNENSTNIDMGYFVLNSNNVAWKNVSILNSIYNSAVVSVSNPYQTLKPFRLSYKLYPNKANELLYKYADVYLTLSSDLFKIWERSNFAGTGFKKVGENKILLTGENAILDNLMLEPNKHYTIESQVNFFTQAIPENNQFTFDIVQYVNENDKINLIGGERYIAIRDKGRDFKAVALEDTTIFANETVTFYANTINEDATYTWYNQSGDTIATGTELTTTPITTNQYKLEVVSDSDGFKDFDTIIAIVRNGAITSLSPNPATNQVTVSYRLASNINNAIIKVTNTIGIAVHTATISSLQTSTTLNIQTLVSGQYSVQLLSTSGDLLDYKNLIVQ